MKIYFAAKLFFTTPVLLLTHLIYCQETIQFSSKDELAITADAYIAHPKEAPFIVLFHQASWSRGEYLEIAPQLNQMGFNCMAIDQRSGDQINGLVNETKKRATAAGKQTDYLDALGDMYSAIAYAKKHYSTGKMIIWGSSYSASLSLKIAGDAKEKIDAVLAFAPGEYFKKPSEKAITIKSSAKNIQIPTFITSAKNEKDNWWEIYQSINTSTKKYYLPKTQGSHGSRALWKKFPHSESYWTATKIFLKQFLDS